METHIGIRGKWAITRQCKKTGEILGRKEFKNDITEAGFLLWMDLVTGASAHYFDSTHSRLILYDDTPDIIKTFVGADAGPVYDDDGRHAIVWRWDDISVDEYEVDSVRFDNSPRDPVVIFSEASPTFDGGNVKPESENWLYEYSLEFDLSGGETRLQLAALTLAFRKLGDVGSHGLAWNTTNIKLAVQQVSPLETTYVDCTNIDTGHSPVEGFIQFRFLSTFSDGAHHEWNNLVVTTYSGGSPVHTIWSYTGVDLGEQIEEEMQWTVNWNLYFEFV